MDHRRNKKMSEMRENSGRTPGLPDPTECDKKHIRGVSNQRKSTNFDLINNNVPNETKSITKARNSLELISNNNNMNDNESMSSGYFSNYLSTESKSEYNVLASGGGKLFR